MNDNGGYRTGRHTPDFAVIVLALAAGCVAAAQVGKVPPAIDAIREELSMSLVGLAWVASAISAATATLGVVVALAIARIGAHLGLAGGLALLALGSVAGAGSPFAGALIASRLVEGAGFVLVVVSAPSLIAALLAHDPQRRRALLTVWSCYMPAGIAAMMGIAPLLLEAHGWRALWTANALVLAAALAVALASRRRLAAAGRPPIAYERIRARDGLRLPGPWLMGACFGCFSAIWFIITTWLPTFAVEDMGYTLRGATWLTAIAVVGNIAGNLGTGFLVRAGLRRWLVLALVQVLLGALGWLVFTAGADPLLRSLAAVAACTIAGALPATIMTGVPLHATSPAQIVVANGIVFQCANLGSLAGPPVVAAAVAALGGWDGGRWLIPALAALGVAAAFALRGVERRIAERARPEPALAPCAR